MQPKDMKSDEEPRSKTCRRYNKGKSAKKAEQKEEPTKQAEHSKKEWREKEMPARSLSLGPTEASTKWNLTERSYSMDLKHGALRWPSMSIVISYLFFAFKFCFSIACLLKKCIFFILTK